MSKLLNIAIVEDQQENIDVLKFFLAQFPDKYKIGYVVKTGDEARQILTNQDIDLCLLDIDLGDETIFDVLNDIDYRHLNQSLVFITAHGTFENALRAIRYSCLNFITKPIDFKELGQTFDQVINEKNTSNQSQIDVLLSILKENPDAPTKIGALLPKGIVQFLECKDILYITAADDTSTIYYNGEEKLRSTRHLGYYAKLLENHPEFLRIHKSTLVNRGHIYKFNPRNRLLIMSNQEELEISKRRLAEIQNMIV